MGATCRSRSTEQHRGDRVRSAPDGPREAQVAVAWLLAKRGVSTVLVGATKLHQLEDNLGATDLHLSAEAIARLDEASPHADYYPK